MARGDVFRMSTYTHVQPDVRWTFKIENRKNVGVFLFLGEEPKDGSQPLDLIKAMNDLGWYMKPQD